MLRRHPRGVGRVDAGDAEEVLAGMSLLTHEFDRLFGDKCGVRHVVAAAGRQRTHGESFSRMVDPILHVHRLLPDFGHRRQAPTDVWQLVGRVATYPGSIGIFVRAGFVGDFQVVEAVSWVMSAVIAVGVGLEVQLADVGRAVAVRCQQAGQRDGILGHGHAHVGDAEGGWILPREKTEAAGHTDGVLDETVIEADACARQTVQMGCTEFGGCRWRQGHPSVVDRCR